MAKLKVYRTPIGFHDAYVAATSQKAALAAWGSARDLFARGIAEVVTDPALTAAPLAEPGTVVRRSRGSAAEQMAALPSAPARTPRAAPAEDAAAPAASKPKAKSKPEPKPKPKPKPKPVPRPDRSALADAEQAVAEAAARQRGEERALRAEEAALAKRRRALEREHRDESERLAAARQRAADAYARALRRWEGDRQG